MKKLIQEFLRDETGQSTTEYILILSVVVMIAIKFKQTFGSRIDGIVGKLGQDIDNNISTNGQ